MSSQLFQLGCNSQKGLNYQKADIFDYDAQLAFLQNEKIPKAGLKKESLLCSSDIKNEGVVLFITPLKPISSFQSTRTAEKLPLQTQIKQKIAWNHIEQTFSTPQIAKKSEGQKKTLNPLGVDYLKKLRTDRFGKKIFIMHLKKKKIIKNRKQSSICPNVNCAKQQKVQQSY